ncbi:MAG TPA: aminopeptidase P family protein [Dehalococcoidales bacterium]|nr:aminopeptidase P family protein [Dehalococcoidales bacterium]
MNQRVLKLRRLFGDNKIDGIFITQAENRRYLSGFFGTAGYLFITQNKAVLATDFRYTEQAAGEAPDFEILRIGGKLTEWFPKLVSDFAVKRLGFEPSEVSYDFHAQLENVLKKKGVKAKLVPVSGLVESLRAVKEPDEIELIMQASVITDAAFNKVSAEIKAGMTELQIAWMLEKEMRESGSQALPFEIIIASGPEASLPHHKPTGRALKTGDPVVIDMGAKVNGYATDLSRTVCIGEPGAQYKKVYHIVMEAQHQAIEAICAGMTGGEADAIARNVIKKAGYGEAFGHSLGHGVGLQEHEAPRLGPGSKDVLGNNMVFTIEPGIYIPGWGGVRIEDTVILEKGKVKLLTGARKVRL